MSVKNIPALSGWLFFAGLLCLSAFLPAANLPAGFAEVAVAEGLNPTAMALAPDGRLFLAQKDGRVLILHGDGELHEDPFIVLEVDDFNERGLAGIALHPNFDQEPWVYLYYTARGRERNRITRVLANGDFAVPGSEQVLLELDLMSGNIHNGGALAFGPDDNLYIGVGDGAAPASAQNKNTLLGKILRLGPSGIIPADNPFYNELSGNLRAIYAYGVRNPFSMSCDPLSGQIFFCDVGNGAWEEVNDLLPGKNYGWSLIEGPSAGQPIPSDYQEPLFAYPHAQGCAVVGAAFGFSAHPAIPAEFQGKFFFADYCAGWIRMLDPDTGEWSGSFATGIDRPVSLLVTPAGELYYFARAGLGGGSPGDNTASDEGTLWKVFWLGQGAPLVTRQPQDYLAPENENAYFTVQAYGSQPLYYQWYRNGVLIPDSDTTTLVLEKVNQLDNGSVFSCQISNTFGATTSSEAILTVTLNQRPFPQLLFPSANATYRCGDTLQFVGQAVDPEEGILSANQLSWRIDFHHAGHTHPAMSQTAGISEGFFVIPTVGETATDVFFRIYLTATDSAGLSQTVWQDVLPQLTTFSVDGPAGLPVNVDGQILTLPVEVPSVVNIRRNLQATTFYQGADTLLYFRQWSNGQQDPLLTFQTPEAHSSWVAEYDQYVLGHGTGLKGAYFFDLAGDFSGTLLLVRQDTTVHFNWDESAPDPLVPANYFSVRWTGYVQPVFGGEYTFYVRSDDGARLWIGDSLLIDEWVPQAATEHSGVIALQKGAYYPIRLEYFEITGGAVAELRWSSDRQPKEIIPKRQLYYPDSVRTAAVQGIVGLDEDLNGQWTPGETPLPGALVSLFLAANDSLIEQQTTLANGRYAFLHLLPGNYYLKVQPNATAGQLVATGNIDPDGYTSVFHLEDFQTNTLHLAWVIAQNALYGTVWLDENRNSLQDNAEEGLENIAVLLYRGDSTFVSATSTDGLGGYLFPLIAPGTYFLWFSDHLSGLPFIEPGHGMDAEGFTPLFPLSPGQGRELLAAYQPGLASGSATHENLNGQLRAWPNPAHHELYVRLMASSAEYEYATLEIYDGTGRRVFEQRELHLEGNAGWALPVGALQNGLYTLVCRMGANQWYKRWVKE